MWGVIGCIQAGWPYGGGIHIVEPSLFFGSGAWSRALALAFLLFRGRGLGGSGGGYRFWQTEKLYELCDLDVYVPRIRIAWR